MMYSPLVTKCSAVPVPDRGEVTPDSCKTGAIHGTTCTFACMDRFELVGTTTASCSNGGWNVNPNFNCVGELSK